MGRAEAVRVGITSTGRCKKNPSINSTQHPVIAVHGGAWAIPDTVAEASVTGVKLAVKEGFRILQQGGTAVDAVVAAVSLMEDNPVFDAGKKALFCFCTCSFTSIIIVYSNSELAVLRSTVTNITQIIICSILNLKDLVFHICHATC